MAAPADVLAGTMGASKMFKVQDTINRIHQVCAFVETLARISTNMEAMVFNRPIEKTFEGFPSFRLESRPRVMDREFASKYRAIQEGARKSFTCIKQDGAAERSLRQPPVAQRCGGLLGTADRGSTLRHKDHHTTPPTFHSESTSVSKRAPSADSLGPVSSSFEDVGPNEEWSNGGADILNNASDFGAPQDSPAPLPLSALAELSSMYLAVTCVGLHPLKSRIKRPKMIYHCKIGKLGVMEGLFTEPSGVAVNAQNDIVVADNHRTKIFVRDGRFKFQHIECGKSDVHPLYPNRLAVLRHSSDIVVTERSPTHQIQIYDQYGHLVRRFEAEILQHSMGVAVNLKGRSGTVDCKVMWASIFDRRGKVVQRFGCSKRLELLRVKLSHLQAAVLSFEAERSLDSSLPTTLRKCGTTAGSQLGSPTSLREAFMATSPGGEMCSGGSPSDSGCAGSRALPQLSTKCSLCHDTCTTPKVLICFHTFCQPCLEKEWPGDEIRCRCPQCSQDTPLPIGGMAGLPSDCAVSNILETVALGGAIPDCTGCTGKESSADACCFDCANSLCPNCVMAHQFMHCFEGSWVLMLRGLQSMSDELRVPRDKPVACLRHRSEALRYFCLSCDLPVCKEWALLDHPTATGAACPQAVCEGWLHRNLMVS